MKIRSKLFVMIFSFIIMTLLATSFASINIFSSILVSKVKENLETNTKNLSKGISTSLSQRVTDAKTLGILLDKFHFLNRQAPFFIGEKELALNIVRYVAAKDNVSLSVYNSTGINILNTDYNATRVDNDFLNGKILNVLYHGNVYQDEIPAYSDSISIVRIAAPIYNGKSITVDGAILLAFPLSNIFKNVNTSISYLLSSNGTILYSNYNEQNTNTDSNNSLKRIGFVDQPIFQDIKNSKNTLMTAIYPNITNGNKDTVFVATKVDEEKAAINEVTKSYDDNNQDKSSPLGWFLITSTDADNAFKDIVILKNLFVFITIVTLSICAVAVLLMSKRFSRPLTNLKDAAIAISKGNLELVITPPQTYDEIDELAFQLETMRMKVKRRTVEILNKERELESVNKLLLQTERSKDEFMTILSHELKNSISPLTIYSQMLLRADIGELNGEQKKAIRAISRSIEKLQRLASDILDTYKLEIGKMTFSKSEVKITDLLREAIDELLPYALDKQIKLVSEVRVGPNTITVYCDALRISQVLSNLIRNSIDFVAPIVGRIIVIAEEYCEYKGDYYKNYDGQDGINKDDYMSAATKRMIIFTVQDNGVGIPQDKVERLFEKFYQLDSGRSRKHGGTGLGLVICKGIVEAHGGKIWVDKSYTKGAAIMFSLPGEKTNNK
jgi:signal transduction histidine kinase